MVRVANRSDIPDFYSLSGVRNHIEIMLREAANGRCMPYLVFNGEDEIVASSEPQRNQYRNWYGGGWLSCRQGVLLGGVSQASR